MTITKRIFNNVLWLSLSEVISKSLMFFGTIYLARVLGNAGFGLFSFSLAVGVYFWVVSDVGITQYGVREVARNKEKAGKLYNTLNSMRFILALLLFIVFSCILYFADIPLEKKTILLSGASFAVAYSLSSDWVFRGMEKMQYIFIGRIATSLSFLVGIYLLVKSDADTVTASVMYSASTLLGSLTFLILLSKKFNLSFSLEVSMKEWIVHIKESFYFAINGVFNNSSLFIPIFFMGLWNTNEEIGIFSAPHRLIMMVIRVSTLVISALYPPLSSLYVADRANFQKVHAAFLKVVIGISAPVFIVAAMFSKEIMLILFGKSYGDSGIIFHVMIWFTFLLIIRRSIGNALFSAGFQRCNMFASGAGFFILILTSLVLMHKYDSYVAAWTLISGEVITLLIMSFFFRQKVYFLEFLAPYGIKILLVSAAMVLIMAGLPFSKLSNSFIGIFAYCLMLPVVGIVKKNSLQELYIKIVK